MSNYNLAGAPRHVRVFLRSFITCACGMVYVWYMYWHFYVWYGYCMVYLRASIRYKLTEWSEKWQMLFNYGKFKCLYSGHGNEDAQHTMGDTVLNKRSKAVMYL